jgi:acetyl esterase
LTKWWRWSTSPRAKEPASASTQRGSPSAGSAGANLALAAALASRDAGERGLGFMLLIYGASRPTREPVWQRFGQGAGLSQTQMRWIWETYLERPEQRNDWRAVPILADLCGLPPAHLIVGSLDPLLDDSHRLASALKRPECAASCPSMTASTMASSAMGG